MNNYSYWHVNKSLDAMQVMLAEHRIDRCHDDFSTIVCGISLLVSISLDSADMLVSSRGLNRVVDNVLKARDALLDNVIHLDDFLLRCDAAREFCLEAARINAFNKHCITMIQKRFGDDSPLWRIVISPLIGADKGVDDKTLFACAYQSFSFLRKIRACRDDLIPTIERDLIELEDHLASREPTLDYLELCSEMKQLLLQHIDHFDEREIIPRHGRGAVSVPSIKSIAEKDSNYNCDRRIQLLLTFAGLGSELDWHPVIQDCLSTRTTRFICVPKSWNKLRGISAEPVELMYWQSGVQHAIDSMFRNDPWWTRRVQLHNQTVSGDLARIGSLTGSYATIDLSAASDSVSLDLVKRVFGNTRLALWVLGTRSTHTRLSTGMTLELNKFAPMGSSCCFPVECIVFTLIAELAVRHTRIPEVDSSVVRVYGDDIVISYYAYDECIRLLTIAGFKVNTLKSYNTGVFREACGVHAYKGIDVNPITFRDMPSYLKSYTTIGDVGKVQDLCNRFYASGYMLTRRLLLEHMLRKRIKVGKHSVPSASCYLFTTYGSTKGTWSVADTNYRLQSRYYYRFKDKMCSLYCTEYRVTIGKAKPIVSAGCDTSLMLSQQQECEYSRTLIAKAYQERTGALPREPIEFCSKVPLGFILVPSTTWQTTVESTKSTSIQKRILQLAMYQS